MRYQSINVFYRKLFAQFFWKFSLQKKLSLPRNYLVTVFSPWGEQLFPIFQLNILNRDFYFNWIRCQLIESKLMTFLFISFQFLPELRPVLLKISLLHFHIEEEGIPQVTVNRQPAQAAGHRDQQWPAALQILKGFPEPAGRVSRPRGSGAGRLRLPAAAECHTTIAGSVKGRDGLNRDWKFNIVIFLWYLVYIFFCISVFWYIAFLNWNYKSSLFDARLLIDVKFLHFCAWINIFQH